MTKWKYTAMYVPEDKTLVEEMNNLGKFGWRVIDVDTEKRSFLCEKQIEDDK